MQTISPTTMTIFNRSAAQHQTRDYSYVKYRLYSDGLVCGVAGEHYTGLKKNDDFHICIDFHNLNLATPKDE